MANNHSVESQLVPKVSVVLCTYNGEEYLSEQIDSLLSQTYPIYEIVVQDDGSEDRTWEIIESYKHSYPSLFKIFKNKTNLYFNQNFYSAILKTTGDLIVLCDQDDIWLPNKIQYQVDTIGNDLITVCSSYYWKKDTLAPLISQDGTLARALLIPLHFGHQMMMRSEIKSWIHIGVNADIAHDRFLTIVGEYLGSLHTSPEILVKWRRHANTTTGELKTDQTSGKKKIILCLKALIIGRKSPVITQACNKFYLVLHDLNTSSGVHPSGKKLEHLMRLLRDQTLFDYIKASLIIASCRKDIFGAPRISSRPCFSQN